MLSPNAKGVCGDPLMEAQSRRAEVPRRVKSRSRSRHISPALVVAAVARQEPKVPERCRVSGSVLECEHMLNRMPYPLADEEWEAVAGVRQVAEAFALEDRGGGAGAVLKDSAYGVRFEFVSDGPGYVGPLYLIKGAGSPGMPPIALIENQGKLQFTADYCGSLRP